MKYKKVINKWLKNYKYIYKVFLNKPLVYSFVELSRRFVGFSLGRFFFIMAKKKTLKQHKDRIDRVFHEYIRRRDVNSDGYGACISCNKPIHFSESDAGHFISRQHLSVRWDERNVHLQCRKCNRFEYGRQYEYSLKLGAELSEELLQLSRSISKFSDPELTEIYESYKLKLNELKNNQNF